MKSKFRNAQNKYLTKSLFLEMTVREDEMILYSLEREDTEGYPSLYRLYMETGDLTEYRFAEKYFDGFTHWKEICKTAWFHPYIGEWREELELKIRSIALQMLIDKSESSTDVAKYLLNNNWVDKLHDSNPVNNLRGRPSKQDIKNNLTLITNQSLQEQQNYERIKNL